MVLFLDTMQKTCLGPTKVRFFIALILLRNRTGPPDDPVAVAMFHDLIDHLCSDACQPSLQAIW